MIDYIRIRDFAIIENTEVEFGSGLNIITGETGSGKSVVIEAISLALGSRADNTFVRHGKDKAVIELKGNLNNEEIVITRELSSSGKNLCRLNGNLVTLAELQRTCKKLADIHGQYDNQSLLNTDNHLKLIDKFGEDDIRPVKDDFELAYKNYSEKKSRLKELEKLQMDNARKLDFYRFEKQEIENANLILGEDQELEERITLLQNSEKIFDGVEGAYSYLNAGENDARTSIGNALSALQGISSLTSSLEKVSQDLNDVYYNLEDVISSLRDITEEASFSPEELDQAISRLDTIDNLKKKYGGSIEEILDYYNRISTELDSIENYDQLKEKLEKEVKELYILMMDKADKLTKIRKEKASILSKAIEKELHDLNFTASKLEAMFTTPPEITSSGNDLAEFLISTNPGEPLKPLVKIASGGEISRIMLAIKNITGSYDNIPTMIFDEIDAGISGITASVVGRKLREISKNHQIICITHLPQIAAAGDYNYRIHKETDNNSTFTNIDSLSKDETVKEIARLLGGENITDITLQSAKELISSSK